MTPQLVLASKSPRRADLLGQMGLRFTAIEIDIDEATLPGELPSDYVQRLAIAKCRAGFAQLIGLQLSDREGQPAKAEQASGRYVVLGSDTTVTINNEILGKPCGPTEGEQMLRRLSGKTHRVMTAVAGYDGEHLESFVEVCEVTFRHLAEFEIESYCALGEGADKAGGYGIQGIGGIFAERISGSYSAVVGLPVAQTEVLLGKLNIDTWSMRIDG